MRSHNNQLIECLKTAGIQPSSFLEFLKAYSTSQRQNLKQVKRHSFEFHFSKTQAAQAELLISYLAP
jgi:hypothetical protein